jgi:geranylgeranylglycerol-phosphate geranylgeranyltransferase
MIYLLQTIDGTLYVHYRNKRASLLTEKFINNNLHKQLSFKGGQKRMANAQVSAADVLFYRNAPTERSFRNKIIGLIALPGVGIDIAALPLAIGIAALAGARFDDLRLLPLLIIVFLALGVANIVNDIVDAERDKTKWPLRPLATGLLSRSEAILYAAILSAIGIVMAIVVFNWLFLALGLLVLAGNLAYSRYLRDNIGYLTVMLPFVLVPAAIWSAFSPETILTPLPWLLAIFLTVYSPVPSMMQEALDPQVPTFFVRLRPTAERALYVMFVIALFVSGIAILLYAQLSWLFAVVLAVLTVWLLIQVRNLGDNRSREKLEIGFKITMASISLYWLSLAVFAWAR